MSAAKRSAGDAGLDWPNLGFVPRPVNGHAKCVWTAENGWGRPEFVTGATLELPIWGNALHYGQSLFEGQKVFHCKDGKVRIFNDKENWERLQNGCQRMMLPAMPWELFQECMDIAVRENVEFVPPYGSGCSLYVRPLLFGSSAQMSVAVASEATFLIMVAPVGNYFKTGGLTPVTAVVVEGYDRAAPQGVGHCKAAGNYAADMKANAASKKEGHSLGLYLDAREHKYVEEFGTSNFVAIVGDTYLTAESPSILASVTNKCLTLMAKDVGLKVERRPIDFFNEVSTFDEVGAVGTAVVVQPVKSITAGGQTWEFKPPSKLTVLHDKLKRIQVGDEEDTHGFLREIPL